MRYWGLDVHKKIVQAVLIDEHGKVLKRLRFGCNRDELEAFCRKYLVPDDRIALEATTNTWGVVDILAPHVAEVVVSNPLKTRAIAEAKIKTDRVDALVLAQLLRADYLPRVWVPDPDTRQRRQLATARAVLVADRTRLKNRIHAVLHERLIQVPVSDLFSKKGLAFLQELELDELGRATLDSHLRLLESVEKEIGDVDGEIARRAYRHDQIKLLMTLPGVDVAVAHTLLATLGDVSRFPSGDEAASYVGIVPRTKQSADHCYHGPITKQGKGHARWVLVQAAQHLDRHPGPLGNFFRRLAKKKNRNVAVVATARKMVVIAWHMLTNNEPYRYATPKSTQQKLARLRVKATGKRRRGGIPKGSARPANYGTGQSTHFVPSVDQVYVSEELPELRPLTDGEKRTIRRAKAVKFVKDIHQSHRIVRKRAE